MKERVIMPLLPLDKRQTTFCEVSLGLTKPLAILEASRCLNCANPQCVSGCPVNVNIPLFISKINTDVKESYKVILESNLLPSICGRVCPQESQCEKLCVLNKVNNPISIGALERYVADTNQSTLTESSQQLQSSSNVIKENTQTTCDKENIELAKNTTSQYKKLLNNSNDYINNDDITNAVEKNNFTNNEEDYASVFVKRNSPRVAVIGSGPSGLACAGTLNSFGFDVTILECLPKFGGVLTYGIPSFRLPKNIVEREVLSLKNRGVILLNNFIVGKNITLDELKNNFDAVFIGVGAGLPNFMNIKGEEYLGVYSANEFLTRVNLCKANDSRYDTPLYVGKNVAVVGGGNVAMDSARTALRMGSNVTIIYRRTLNELPARKEETLHAIEEGVKICELTNPIEILADENDWVKAIRNQKMVLGEMDESGRRSPIPQENSEFEMEADCVIMAIGTSPNPLLTKTTNIEKNKRGCILVDSNGQTTIDGVFAGGDIVSGAATVISAMGQGKKCAIAIKNYIENKRK